ncbi:cytochrome P450 71AU50-like [Salvia splendens]|uniref:cytochrome P450 71AU50-like n=1 Tax=Salvia splendens TaxID=180675 RepID=UPI001C27A128|nr:cytochrome P450 71AU50-like [Salvia splendens]
MAWIWLVLSVIVFVYFLRQQLGRKNKKRLLPPGPKGLPILGHFHLLGKNPHRDLHRLAQKHGPIMGLRFGFVPTLVVSSPAAAELVLKTHDLIFASRPPIQAAVYIAYDQRDIAFGPYGPFWRHMRKLCALKLLSNHKISQFEPMRRAELGLLVASLERAAENREAVDLSARVSALSGDMNFLMLFGKKYSTMEEIGFKDVIRETMEIFGKFNLADYFPYIGVLNLQGLHGKMKRVSNIFDGILEEIIDDHMKMKRHEEQQTADIVDTLMEIMESGQAGFEFDRRHVKAVLYDMIVGGMDTSSTTLDWAMSELMKHPAVMKKLQQELESVVGLDQMVEESHLEKLQYLDCVVKEAMRLHPVGPLLIPHESMEDCEVGGFHVPKKARVIVNVWAIGRDPGAWADPDSFAPERFIGSQIDLRGHHFELLPFGAGRRGCPGLQLGLTVVKLVLAQLVHCFDWKLPDGMKGSEVDMTENFGVATSRAMPLVAVPTCRLHKY